MRTTTSVSLLTSLKQIAARQARREHRSLSGLISFALEQYLRSVGVWREEMDDAELC